MLLTLFLLSGLAADCRKKECNCEWPKEDYVDAKNYWMFRHHLGDTLKFNVYRVETKDSQHIYHYLREEEFVGTDSSEVVEYEEIGNSLGGNCPCIDESYNRHQLCLTFKGEERDLKYMIRPAGVFDDIWILLEGTGFDLPNTKFFHSQYTDYTVLGKKYETVTAFSGYDCWRGCEPYYKDSTAAFINYNDGLIKFIINDTLAYLRKP